MAPDTSGMKEMIQSIWDESAERYDTQHAHGIQSEEEHAAWIALFKQFTSDTPVTALDIGCGTGEMSLLLAEMGHCVHAIDLSQSMLKKAGDKARKKGYPISFSCEDAESLSFDDESFDLVINRHLLWTLPDPDKALREWNRVLKPGGTIAVIDGLWLPESLSGKSRRFISKLGILISERRNPFKSYYPDELVEHLPHPKGMEALEAVKYAERAGFQHVSLQPLDEIMSIQKKYMRASNRIAYQMPYYLVHGVKFR